MLRHLLRACPGLLALALWAVPLPSASASELPPAQLYLQQATSAARQIELGGDQSAARRDIALALLGLDEKAAHELIAGIGRPANAARVLAALASRQPAAPAAVEAPKKPGAQAHLAWTRR